MTALRKITVLEAKLFVREPAGLLLAVALPTLLLVALGAVPALRRPDQAFDGQRFIDVFVPSLVVLTVAVLGANILPIRLAGYREKGVLRRMSTTPVHPANLLAAQLIVNLISVLVSVALLVAVGRLVFDVPMPRHWLGFLAAFLLGTGALFALGLLVAALAPGNRAATAMVMPIYLVAMFFGGVYLPRYLLPDLLVRIGDYTPPGVLQLGIMAIITIVVGGLAAKVFRWE